MKKANYLNELKGIQNTINLIKNIKLNENINFSDTCLSEEDDELPPVEDEEPCVDEPCKPCTDSECCLDNCSEVDTIREITLKGMTKLCKTPDAPEFQTLLKIFQMCNKVGKENLPEEK